MIMFADIAFPISSYTTFTYSVTDNIKSKIRIGLRVSVSLGKRNTTGIVVGFPKKSNYKGAIKEIVSLVDQYPILDEPLWKLILWMSNYYFTPIGQVAKTVLPKQLSMDYSPKKIWMVKSISDLKINKLDIDFSNSPAQKSIYNKICKMNEKIRVSKLKKISSNPLSVCRALNKKGLVELTYEESVPDITGFTFDPIKKKIVFSKTQKTVLKEIFSQIQKKKFISNLLHGVTGSGKTEVYIEAVRFCLENNLSAIVLLPEISLTPQIAGRFGSVFGSDIALWHSRMTQGLRVWTWKKIGSGDCRIVLGARSAIFTPVKNLGLIIVDEEQESAYKQDSPAPRYHARDVALMRGKLCKAVVVLASATPSLESYYNSSLDKYNYLSLPERFGGAYYPTVTLIDMKEEHDETGKNDQMISGFLLQKIQSKLKSNEQIILLQNRRGYAPVVRCRDCGLIFECPHCKLPLTFHKAVLKLKCHSCDYINPNTPDVCVDCKSTSLKLYGTGTQKVEEFLKQSFPKAKISRVDTDNIKTGKSLVNLLKKFKNREIDILIGTQMIAKGLDFENVTLVGIVNADTGLYLPDFRAGERVFQLIYQAAGRAGRHKKLGEVVIQTYQPESPVIKYSSELNIKGYYDISLDERKSLSYSPFSWMCRIIITSKSISILKKTTKNIYSSLSPAYSGLKILGPAPCYREKTGDRFRHQLIFKSSKKNDPNGRKLHSYLKKNFTAERLIKRSYVRVDIDINPATML